MHNNHTILVIIAIAAIATIGLQLKTTGLAINNCNNAATYTSCVMPCSNCGEKPENTCNEEIEQCMLKTSLDRCTTTEQIEYCKKGKQECLMKNTICTREYDKDLKTHNNNCLAKKQQCEKECCQ